MTQQERNSSIRSHTVEEKEAVQEILLDMYSRRVKTNDMIRQVQENGCTASRATLLDWLKDAISKQALPDPAYALRRDLLLVDACIEALIPSVLKGNAAAHMALSKWMDRRAKWLGLDAPDKLEAIIKQIHTGPIEDEIQALSARLGLPPREITQ